MAKLGNRVVFDVQVGEAYIVIDVEGGHTPKTGAEILRVTLANEKASDPKVYGMTLWPREDDLPAGSPLGAMVVALGDEPNLWVGKTFFTKTWGSRNCEITAIKENKKKRGDN